MGWGNAPRDTIALGDGLYGKGHRKMGEKGKWLTEDGTAWERSNVAECGVVWACCGVHSGCRLRRRRRHAL